MSDFVSVDDQGRGAVDEVTSHESDESFLEEGLSDDSGWWLVSLNEEVAVLVLQFEPSSESVHSGILDAPVLINKLTHFFFHDRLHSLHVSK